MSLKEQITDRLRSEFSPSYLSVENESGNHHVPPGSETHFKVVIVSEVFANKNRVVRQREVYRVLSEQLAAGVHALAQHTYTPEEWSKKEQAPESPQCVNSPKS